jgi:hypothetical protein
MPCRVLISATEHRKAKKGQVVYVGEDSHRWGSKEGPPNFIRMRVPDMTPEEFRAAYAQRRTQGLTVIDDGVIAQKRTLRIQTATNLAAVEEEARADKTTIQDYLATLDGASIKATARGEVTVEVDDVVTQERVASELHDQFTTTFGPAHLIPAADVDANIGGTFDAEAEYEQTAAQLAGKVEDRRG